MNESPFLVLPIPKLKCRTKLKCGIWFFHVWMFKGLVANHDYKHIEAILQSDNHTILFKSLSVGYYERAKVLHDPYYHNSKKSFHS